jgi:5-methylcytosine-specific restriction endonuclease McrA
MLGSILLSGGLTEFQKKLTAWNNAHIILGADPALIRRDDFGWIIHWIEYGNRDSEFGWEVDHRMPTALGGADISSNLRALNWRNNASLGGLLAGALSGRP